MAIPAMAPPERPEEWWPLDEPDEAAALDDVGDPVEVGLAPALVVKGSGVDSEGQGSPGSSMNVDFFALSFWTARTWVPFFEESAFGLSLNQ